MFYKANPSMLPQGNSASTTSFQPQPTTFKRQTRQLQPWTNELCASFSNQQEYVLQALCPKVFPNTLAQVAAQRRRTRECPQLNSQLLEIDSAMPATMPRQLRSEPMSHQRALRPITPSRVKRVRLKWQERGCGAEDERAHAREQHAHVRDL